MNWCFIVRICVLFSYGFSQPPPCPSTLTIDITDDFNPSNQSIQSRGLNFPPKDYFYQDGRILGCVCNLKRCVRKCCDEGKIFKGRKCVPADETFEVPVYNGTELSNKTLSDFFVLYGKTCPKTHVGIASENAEYIYIQENGDLFYSDWNETFAAEKFCFDIFDNDTNISTIMCAYHKDDKMDVYLNTTGMIISMPFLLATFLVYLILPERNLHRKALMSYVFTLLAAYITLVTIQMYPYQFKPVPCQILGYCIIFFFLVSFFWMNVMCIDMWLAFSGMRTVMSKKYAERKRFIIYCIYAWGTPIIHVGIVLLLNTHSPPDADYYPKIGDPRCFLGDGMPTFYYFYLPMAIIIGINIVFFILTTVRIQQIKKETSMLKQTESKKSYEDDKQKFNLYLKLMFAMGINWIMELISWTVEKLLRDTPTFIWYLSDFTNAMYGVLIFVIFVFKKKIWQSLKKRYYVFIGKPHLAHSFTTSSARGTRASNYSTTDTAVSTDYRLNDMKRIPEESALNRT
ncbi:G-protein coupled receptor Mth2-like isoform X1 [Diorhabda sublineata]|uniref:G-protein coupled receptor Mth2-like isoform X1 n=1 Tax=Diorhabda sublineata TaxID=1163346 RepID=UPI0024E08F23|nr:G-protein coupled receptor Mth2-like isoform X1 [Diorhabda sublineata]